ncbi:MAG: OB-fold nucleic acid binding domain-containing protein [Candidatus Aenigmatarchaeota archaeon]
MPIKRQTAKKVRILELMSGQWVKKEGMEPSYVQMASGEQVARARVLGTVVNVFLAEDGMFASATLDDGTDTIRAKTFKTAKPLDSLKVGDIVDAIGKVREWNEEVYIIPETVTPVQDPNLELLRRAELLKRGKAKAEGEKPAAEAASDKEELRKKVLALIESAKEGMAYSEVLEKTKIPEEKLEPIINELLGEGVCYEPSPGKVRKI